ncbi:protein TolQ [Moraxella canis]|uniref:Protein TolQ n=1 Tax=Moraxella canis TaxID=90239 RepID=A0ABZ0WXP6_9GAMM|nr:protein TolQ [Moraxella canis]WQE04038.1 protein TolQ [Moraxella canis]
MNESISLISLIIEASIVVKLVMALLLLLSMISWVLIFHLSAKIGGAARFDERFERWFWTDDIDRQLSVVQSESERTGLEAIFYTGFHDPNHQDAQLSDDKKVQLVERRLRMALGGEQVRLEKGLSTLATIGSVSPYIGLFGTVWGIMNAFIGLGQAESVSLATVAPSIAEALIATALGLFAAIPATMAYNHFTAKSNVLYENRSLFCEGLMSALVFNLAKKNTTLTP